MIALAWLKSKAALFGAVLLSALAILTRIEYLKGKARKEGQRADLLEARLERDKIQKRISKKVSKETEKKKEEIKKEVEKNDSDFKGLDNLSDPNDY